MFQSSRMEDTAGPDPVNLMSTNLCPDFYNIKPFYFPHHHHTCNTPAMCPEHISLNCTRNNSKYMFTSVKRKREDLFTN